MNVDAPDAAATALLHEARHAEKRQALFYRALAAAAEAVSDDELSERLNAMHADEQHHLSRLTVRLVELGEAVEDHGNEPSPRVRIEDWETEARAREHDEIARYERLLEADIDAATRTMIRAFLVAERGHAATLGGKWMGA